MSKSDYVLILSQSKNLILQVAGLFEILGWKIVIASKVSEVNTKWRNQDFKLVVILDIEESTYLPLLKTIKTVHPQTWVWVMKDFAQKSLIREFQDKVVYMEMGALESNLKMFCELLVAPMSESNVLQMPKPQEKKKQLIYSLDDDPAISKILDVLFQRLGYLSRVFNDGQVLLEMIKRQKPDLLCLDYSMPNMNGTQVLKVVRSIYPKKDLPVVFISGSNDSEKIQELLEIGINDFIMKPFDEGRVSEKIKRLVG